MKFKYIAVMMLAASMGLTSCSDFTEIDAKGNNLLKSVTDLELLLNSEYGYNYATQTDLGGIDLSVACGDIIQCYSNMYNVINVPVKTANSILHNWDEDGWENLKPGLTVSDQFYNTCYYYICRIANPVLLQIDNATGDASKKPAIKAEALLIRAYFQYLAVQKYCPAYNPDKAASTVCLPYMTEDIDIKQPTELTTLDKYYEKILTDLDAAIALNALPDRAINRMRFGKTALYAVKALVLQSMWRYNEAAEAAQEALKIDGTLVDFNTSVVSHRVQKSDNSFIEVEVFARQGLNFAEDYFTTERYAYGECLTPYLQQFIEPGHVFLTKLPSLTVGLTPEEADAKNMQQIGVTGYVFASNVDNETWWSPCRLSTSQMYLILAEAALHAQKYDDAMGYLDQIRAKRIDPAVYAPLKGKVSDKAEAIRHLKESTYTEGMLTMWNFIHRKRWNQIDGFKETIHRNVCGVEMTLTPESKIWNFPIPQNVIGANPNFKAYLN